MVAEELVEVVEQVCERATRYRQELAASEALTRYALIDPILRALGWPLDEPAVVRPEYPAGQGKADYCLLGADGKPAVLIEAKALGPKLPPIATAAVVSYAWELAQAGTHVEYVGITNGMLWELYRFPNLMQAAHKVNVNTGSIPEATVKLLAALWRPLLVHDAVPPPPPPSPPPAVEIPLSELQPPPGPPPPSVLLLPDGTAVPLRAWRDLLVEVARALSRAGKLDPQHSPIKLRNATTRCIVNTEPIHLGGRRFSRPEQVAERLWIETDTGAGAVGVVKHTRCLLESLGEDPAQYRVRLGRPGQQP